MTSQARRRRNLVSCNLPPLWVLLGGGAVERALVGTHLLPLIKHVEFEARRICPADHERDAGPIAFIEDVADGQRPVVVREVGNLGRLLQLGREHGGFLDLRLAGEERLVGAVQRVLHLDGEGEDADGGDTLLVGLLRHLTLIPLPAPATVEFYPGGTVGLHELGVIVGAARTIDVGGKFCARQPARGVVAAFGRFFVVPPADGTTVDTTSSSAILRI